MDHITASSAGGETSTANIAALCRRHHRAKTHSTWTYATLTPGEYLWTSPNGLHFAVDHTGTTALDP